ncbi:MAG: hypothetical protein RSC49_08285, partial [Clostridium sp.]
MTTLEALEQIKKDEVVTNIYPIGFQYLFFMRPDGTIIKHFRGIQNPITEEEFLTQYSQEPYEGNWE